VNLTDWMRRAARRAALVLPLAGVVAAVGCNEKLDGSLGCPLTCVDQGAQIQTVDLDAVSSATTVLGGLGIGTAPLMLLANRGDTLDTRVIIRFDTLPGISAVSATDTSTATSLQYADSVYLKLRLDSLASKLGASTVSVYDVDTNAGDDTTAATLAPLFTPSRLVGSLAVPAGKLVDSVSIRLPNSFLTSKAAAKAHVRLGVQITAATSASARVFATSTGFGPSITLRNYPDTTTHKPITLLPYSATPTTNTSIANSLKDFTIVVKGTPPAGTGVLAVGGLPGTRAYFRFNVPARIVDSSLVIRATLLLTQVPSSSPDPTDTMRVQPYLVLAGPPVTDPAKAAQIVADTGVVGLKALRTTPASSGVQEVEIAPVFRYWAVQGDTLLPRAVTLRSSQEDFSPQQALFYGPNAADPTVRPKLRISYTLRSRIGLP